MSGFIPTERQASRYDRRSGERHSHRTDVDTFGAIHRCSVWNLEKTACAIRVSFWKEQRGHVHLL